MGLRWFHWDLDDRYFWYIDYVDFSQLNPIVFFVYCTIIRLDIVYLIALAIPSINLHYTYMCVIVEVPIQYINQTLKLLRFRVSDLIYSNELNYIHLSFMWIYIMHEHYQLYSLWYVNHIKRHDHGIDYLKIHIFCISGSEAASYTCWYSFAIISVWI